MQAALLAKRVGRVRDDPCGTNDAIGLVLLEAILRGKTTLEYAPVQAGHVDGEPVEPHHGEPQLVTPSPSKGAVVTLSLSKGALGTSPIEARNARKAKPTFGRASGFREEPRPRQHPPSHRS